MKKLFKKNPFVLLQGQNLIEYSLVLSLVSVISIAGLSTLGSNLKNTFSGMTRTTDETRTIEVPTGSDFDPSNSTSTGPTSNDESTPASCGPESLDCTIRGENCSC